MIASFTPVDVAASVRSADGHTLLYRIRAPDTAPVTDADPLNPNPTQPSLVFTDATEPADDAFVENDTGTAASSGVTAPEADAAGMKFSSSGTRFPGPTGAN